MVVQDLPEGLALSSPILFARCRGHSYFTGFVFTLTPKHGSGILNDAVW